MPGHLRPSAPIAVDALLPGDPARALALAQELIERPRMSNHARGLWGYYGSTTGGRPLTVQSTGIGGPSAAIVLEELAGLGVRRAVRIGTCSALDHALAPGDLLVVDEALAADGLGRRIGEAESVGPDDELTAALLGAAGERARTGAVATSDRFYGIEAGLRRAWADAGAVASDMETATLFALGRGLGVAVGCVLAVSAGPDGTPIADPELERAAAVAGEIAVAALAAGG
jgi:uridine phosphorylase